MTQHALNGWVSIVPIVPIEYNTRLSGVADSVSFGSYESMYWCLLGTHPTVTNVGGCTGLAQYFLTCKAPQVNNYSAGLHKAFTN